MTSCQIAKRLTSNLAFRRRNVAPQRTERGQIEKACERIRLLIAHRAALERA
jgi:hypothetical protein